MATALLKNTADERARWVEAYRRVRSETERRAENVGAGESRLTLTEMTDGGGNGMDSGDLLGCPVPHPRGQERVRTRRPC